MHYTIYKVTNQIDGKIYIGSHKTKDLNDRYMGSGKYLKAAQNKYGIENFTKEILFVFDTPELMYAKESELVNEEFLATTNTYNLKVGGFGGFDYINSSKDSTQYLNIRRDNGYRTGRTNMMNLLERIKDDPVLQEKRNQAAIKGIISIKQKYPSGSFYGKEHSVETKRLIGEKNSVHQQGVNNSNYGNIWITNGVESKTIKKDLTIPDGWVKGRKIKKRVLEVGSVGQSSIRNV